MRSTFLTGLGIGPLLITTACVSTPTNMPLRTQVDGQRGFSMQGVLKFTGDPEKTRARIEKAFVSACRGPAEITHLKMDRQDSRVGLKFYRYDATSKCLGSAQPKERMR
jgi:hypothetical protein